MTELTVISEQLERAVFCKWLLSLPFVVRVTRNGLIAVFARALAWSVWLRLVYRLVGL